MAFNNEFPHVEANKLNHNWLLKQYATFNDRLQELHDHFDESVETMQNSQAAFEQAITNLFNTFKNETNAKVDEIADAVDQINQQTDEYVYNYLSENITEILQNNPTIETRYENKGGINAGETKTIELEQNVVYDVMLNNWVLGIVKILASNNDWNYISLPMITENYASYISAVTTALAPGGAIGDTFVKEITYTPVPVSEAVSYVTVSINNRVMSITNNSQQTITLYMKRA